MGHMYHNGVFASIGHKYLKKYTIVYGYNNEITIGDGYITRDAGDPTKKMLAVAFGGDYSYPLGPLNQIKGGCKFNGDYMDPSGKRKLFVSSGCSIPRDILRNCYDITRKKDIADFVVIPEPRVYASERCVALFTVEEDDGSFGMIIVDIITRDDTVNRFVTFPKNKFEFAEILKKKYDEFNDIDKIDDVFVMDYADSYSSVYRNYKNNIKRTLLFMNPCEEYFDVFKDRYTSYILEHDVKYDAPVKINADVLQIWEHIEDKDLLTKNIVASDWKDYPLTTSLFIYNKFGKHLSPSLYSRGFQDVCRVLNPIFTIQSIQTRMCDMVVTQKDYDMLQDYIFSKIGIYEDKQFVEVGTLKLKSHEIMFVKQRLALAKTHIDKDTRISEIVK